MALRFDSVGTCLIVKQYLEKSQSDMKKKLMVHVDSLLKKCSLDILSNHDDVVRL